MSPHSRSLRAHPLTLWLFCLLVLVLGAARATVVSADSEVELEEARAAAAQGDTDATIAHLEQAVAEDGKLALAHRWLSRLYAEKGLVEKALDSAAAAVLLDNAPGDREQVAHILEGGLPASMASGTPDAIPLPKTTITVAITDDRLPAGGGPWKALCFAGADRNAPARDPRFGWSFDRACHGYVRDNQSGRWRLTFVVHYGVAGGAERSELAGECMDLLLRAACVREAHMGSVGRPARAVDVWLADGGRAGGETWGTNIYLFDVAKPREPTEWVRQILHEYGHAALPGINHFTGPESWANGRLGEQLFSRWLSRSRAEGTGNSWLAAANLAGVGADGERCTREFLEEGLASLPARDRSGAGMDYWLGFANYVESAFGSVLLAQAFAMMPGNTSRGFAVGVQEALRRASRGGIELRALSGARRDDRQEWVYLPTGIWRASCRGAEGTVTFNGYALAAEERPVGHLSAGWHAIALPPGAVVRFVPAED